jgi:feruloyl-CoA synthase
LRARFLAHFEPLVRDVVIAGGDRPEIGALIFPVIDACRPLAKGLSSDADVAAVMSHPDVVGEFRTRLNSFAKTSTGSSNRIARAVLLAEPPSLDAGEMTDKGSINQRAVLSRRAALVEELYAQQPTARVIMIDRKN